MSEQKIDNTFERVMGEINRLQKVFKKDGKFEQAVAELGGDIAYFNDINQAFDNLYDTLEDGHMNAVIHLQHEDVTESKRISEGVLDSDDDDGFMARSQLYFLAKDAIALHGMIDDRDDLEPWVHSKIVSASEGIDAVRRYTEYNAMKVQTPEVGPEIEPELMTAEASSGRMVQEIEKLMHKLNTDMDENRHYGDVNVAKVVQLVQAGDIDGAAEYATGEYHDQDGGQNDSVLDGAYEDLIADLNWVVKNVSESELEEGKIAAFALAALLGWGSITALDATSAKHSPLGQALSHAAEQGDERAEELYNNIDAYAEHNAGALHNWKVNHETLVSQFNEDLETDGRNRGGDDLKPSQIQKLDKTGKNATMRRYVSKKLATAAKQNKKNDPAGEKKGLGPAVVDKEKAEKKAKKRQTTEAEVTEGMEFDQKRNSELKTVAQDVFKNALSNAKKKAKK